MPGCPYSQQTQDGGAKKSTKYEKRTVADLKQVAKTRKIKATSTMTKKQLIAALRK